MTDGKFLMGHSTFKNTFVCLLKTRKMKNLLLFNVNSFAVGRYIYTQIKTVQDEETKLLDDC